MDCTDCGDPTDGLTCGMCRARRMGPPDPRWPRFWAKVMRSDGCWTWTAGRLSTGRGVFDGEAAHRVAWGLVGRAYVPVLLPECLELLCVRPSHMLPFSRKAAVAWLQLHGHTCGPSVLTPKRVRRITEAHADGLSDRAIAEQYGVHRSTVSRALHGKTWRHLHEGQRGP